MKKKKYQEIYYPRTFMCLIILMALTQKKKIKNVKRTLIINKINHNEYKNRTNRKIIDFFRDLLKDYFDDICYVNFNAGLKIKKNFFFSSKSFILRTLAKSNSIKKNLKNLKNLKILKDNTVISKAYCGGDNFEGVLFDILKDKPLFYFYRTRVWKFKRWNNIFSKN